MLYVVELHYPKATTFLLYKAVCCRPTRPETTPKPLKAATSRYKPLQAATSPFCTMLYVVNLHHPKATTFLLYWAVCCRPTVPGTTPKPLKAATSHFCTMVHVVNLHHPKATTLHPFYTGLYVANLHGLKPPQSRYIPLLYYAVCCQPTVHPPKAATSLLHWAV